MILCGISGQFSFAQAALFGMGGYTAAILAAHTAALALLPRSRWRRWSATPRATGLGRIAGGHSLWTQALVSYAFAIAFPQLLRWRLIEQLDRRRAGPLSRLSRRRPARS